MSRERENYRQTAKAWLVEQRRRIDNGEDIDTSTIPTPTSTQEGTAMACPITVDLNTHIIVAHDKLPEVAVTGSVATATFPDGHELPFRVGDEQSAYDLALAALAVMMHRHAEETRIGGNEFILAALFEKLGRDVDRDLIRGLAEAGVTAPRSILEEAS
ncbi:hypothetical protein [Litorihabitans aurantiacus]|uniref:Uncharacterized protein n=1 Tax=Litorihabitans aurantiacus TaxID=1930061 RepID=A0AA37XI53_9MICO|nr:hypothetical protein [Litorihabitans aurantiacus]GMA33524.1 hypothetical protein GCM10025875_35160 [Litorihabitans aurantiacus]GMA33623.1 hypothetical protein GCM10025875_36150 [Litorihabitans aurantiacus]